MDKELKKTIDTLSASVKAIQADLLTLKGNREIAHSDNNSQSSSQYSDLASGNGPAKKRRRILEEESESDREDGKFEQKDTDTELYQLSEVGGAFIETTLSRNWTMQLGRHMLQSTGARLKVAKMSRVRPSHFYHCLNECTSSRPICQLPAIILAGCHKPTSKCFGEGGRTDSACAGN